MKKFRQVVRPTIVLPHGSFGAEGPGARQRGTHEYSGGLLRSLLRLPLDSSAHAGRQHDPAEVAMGRAVRYADPGSEHEVDPWLLTNARPARSETPMRSSREAAQMIANARG